MYTRRVPAIARFLFHPFVGMTPMYNPYYMRPYYYRRPYYWYY